jgi:holo-ACP synthase CitX
MLSLNLPGDEKTGERADKLFAWGERELLAALPVVPVERGSDALGPFALYRSDLEPRVAKRVAMAVEGGHAAGRLLDLDIFDASGRPVDRGSLAIAPRNCLICTEPALACIRAGRHDYNALKEKAQAVIDAL